MYSVVAKAYPRLTQDEIIRCSKIVESESHYNERARCGCEVFHWKSLPQPKISGFRLADQNFDPKVENLIQYFKRTKSEMPDFKKFVRIS
jgi:hypothetical protein